jgi:hypothetical protein
MRSVSAVSCVVRRGSGATAALARSRHKVLVVLVMVGLLVPAVASASAIGAAPSPNATAHKPHAGKKHKHKKHKKHKHKASHKKHKAKHKHKATHKKHKAKHKKHKAKHKHKATHKKHKATHKKHKASHKKHKASHKKHKAGNPKPKHVGSMLFGHAQLGAARGSTPRGKARAFSFVSRRSGTATSIAVYVDRNRARGVTVGLYSGHKGEPHHLLASASRTISRSRGWRQVRIKSTTIASGHRYWVALLPRHGRLYFRDRARGGCDSWGSERASLRSLPSRWHGGKRRKGCELSAVVSGKLRRHAAAKKTPVSPPPAPAPKVKPLVCNLNATPADFSAQVDAAGSGQTVCLSSGDYGTWHGTSKAIVVAAAPGAAPTMQVSFGGGAAGFTLSGMGGMSGTISNGAHDLTIEGSSFTDALVINGLANANVVLNGDKFSNIDDPGCGGQPARIHLPYTTSTPSGVTVENSLFNGGDTDGIQTGAPLTIRDNTFTDLNSSNSDCNHTDSIQGIGSTGVVVVGNLFFNDEDGAVDFDDSTGWTVTDNACYDIDRGACVTLYGDQGSVVEHNTAGPGMAALEIGTKSGQRQGSGTVFENNVGGLNQGDGSTLAVNGHNLFSGAKAPNINGKPVFTGGASPTTWGGFTLAANSPGRNAATDGSDVGIRASVGGPPAE